MARITQSRIGIGSYGGLGRLASAVQQFVNLSILEGQVTRHALLPEAGIARVLAGAVGADQGSSAVPLPKLEVVSICLRTA